MIDLVLATRNRGKLAELLELLTGVEVRISSLADHPEIPEVVEDGDTFLANAHKKAEAVAAACPRAWALADDSGLAVEARARAKQAASANWIWTRWRSRPADSPGWRPATACSRSIPPRENSARSQRWPVRPCMRWPSTGRRWSGCNGWLGWSSLHGVTVARLRMT